jgi:hypothetical protein
MSQTQTELTRADRRDAAKLATQTKVRKDDVRAATPVLDPALLAQIYQLNLDYLELLIAECAAAECAAQLHHLPPAQRSALAVLPARAMRLIAATPYTLYSLGFEDESFWASVCANATEAMPPSVVHRYARARDESAQYAFCKVALLHAWHVATSNPMAARVVYAMPHATVQRLAAAPLWQVQCVASSHAALLMPRWPTNPAFWPDLIRFATANDIRRVSTTRLLGVQLVAAELEVACALSRRDPKTSPSIASPRLRARKLQMEPRGR